MEFIYGVKNGKMTVLYRCKDGEYRAFTDMEVEILSRLETLESEHYGLKTLTKRIIEFIFKR